MHGFVLGIECVAISFLGVCPDCAATLTAPLLNKPDAIRVRWFHDPKEHWETKIFFALEGARVAMEAGNLDVAKDSAMQALRCDPYSGRAQELLEEIERRKSR